MYTCLPAYLHPGPWTAVQGGKGGSPARGSSHLRSRAHNQGTHMPKPGGLSQSKPTPTPTPTHPFRTHSMLPCPQSSMVSRGPPQGQGHQPRKRQPRNRTPACPARRLLLFCKSTSGGSSSAALLRIARERQRTPRSREGARAHRQSASSIHAFGTGPAPVSAFN